MFNFYVVLAGHDMITDAAKATKVASNSKPHNYKQKYKNFRKHGF